MAPDGLIYRLADASPSDLIKLFVILMGCIMIACVLLSVKTLPDTPREEYERRKKGK